ERFGALRASGEGIGDPGKQSAPLKHRLAELCRQAPEVRTLIDHNVRQLNGVPGDPASFDALHALIKAQFYRLAFWRVAADDINYRRFFDINALAALRMERPAVFEDTHRRIFEWIATDKVQALRIDHPDGLLDPRGYFESLQGRARKLIAAPAERASRSRTADLAIYLVLEKIVADYERLPEDWPV